MQPYLEQFIRLSRLATGRPDWIQGPGGNTSVKLPGDSMLVKASGCLLQDVDATEGWVQVYTPTIMKALTHETVSPLQPASMEMVNTAIITAVQETARPGLRPSMETAFHCLFDTCVLHTHNVYANILLCSDRFENIQDCFTGDEPYTASLVEGYYTPGAELSWWLWKLYQLEEAMPNVVLLPNHGLIISAPTVEEVASIHADVQQKIAGYLSISEADYPVYAIQSSGTGFIIQSDYLAGCLRDEVLRRQLFEEFLFPDQLVYLYDHEFSVTDKTAPVFFDEDSGQFLLQKTAREAITITELMLATCFLYRQMAAKEWEPITINFDAPRLRNMGSEQYRQALLKGN